jgi:hypothetical protein
MNRITKQYKKNLKGILNMDMIKKESKMLDIRNIMMYLK